MPKSRWIYFWAGFNVHLFLTTTPEQVADNWRAWLRLLGLHSA